MSDLYSTETSALFDALEGKVSRKHCAELAASALSPDVAKLRGYVTITADATNSLCIGYGFQPYQVGTGLLLPIWDVFGKQAGAMFKPDTSRARKGKPIKYEVPEKALLKLDCPPICQPDLGKPKIDKFITEGVKKADSLASAGRCAIALTGVWGWLGTNPDGGKTALPDWREIGLNDSRVFIVFDSDAASNPNVLKAEQELAAYLTSRGARVSILRIPPAEDDA